MIGKRGIKWLNIQDIGNPKCELCALCNSSKHVCIMGRGSSIAPIVILGEAPGATESDSGKPFMGDAGKLLDEMLREHRMEGSVYITNICKCRPPENRKPTAEERAICGATYLIEELKLLRPKVVVLMGKTPIEFFFGKTPFTRGKVYERTGEWGDKKSFMTMFTSDRKEYQTPAIIPSYHPAYFLHSGSQTALRMMKEHLALAKEIAYANLPKSV